MRRPKVTECLGAKKRKGSRGLGRSASGADSQHSRGGRSGGWFIHLMRSSFGEV